MQIDFHHAVTYVLARLAGFPHGEARIIAYAAQYVDDSVNKGTIQFDNGTSYDHIASSHETFDVANNRLNAEDYSVWVPFHFLPGNNGSPADQDPGVPEVQKLLCQPYSPLAAGMLEACKASCGKPNSLHRLGITTHVFADTFAHQRFAGIRNDLNKASDISLPTKTLADWTLKGEADFVQRIEMKLGHGSVATFPDLPFLEWSYKDNYEKIVTKSNPTIFMEACEKIFEFYLDYRGETPARTIDPQDHELLATSLLKFTDREGEGREVKWMELLRKGGFTSFGPLSDQELSEFKYTKKGEGSWKWVALGTLEAKDSPEGVFPYSPAFESSDYRCFHEALKEHHTFVLETLLPRFKIPTLDSLPHEIFD